MTIPPEIRLFEYYDMGRIAVQTTLVKRGARPAADIVVLKENAAAIQKAIAEEGLHYISEACGETHIEFTVFKHPHLAEIIRAISKQSDGLLKHWCWGKLFGYSEREIGRYLSENGFVGLGED